MSHSYVTPAALCGIWIYSMRTVFIDINSCAWHVCLVTSQGFEQQVLSKWLTRKFIENFSRFELSLHEFMHKKECDYYICKSLLLTIENYIKCHEIAPENWDRFHRMHKMTSIVSGNDMHAGTVKWHSFWYLYDFFVTHSISLQNWVAISD